MGQLWNLVDILGRPDFVVRKKFVWSNFLGRFGRFVLVVCCEICWCGTWLSKLELVDWLISWFPFPNSVIWFWFWAFVVFLFTQNRSSQTPANTFLTFYKEFSALSVLPMFSSAIMLLNSLQFYFNIFIDNLTSNIKHRPVTPYSPVK